MSVSVCLCLALSLCLSEIALRFPNLYVVVCVCVCVLLYVCVCVLDNCLQLQLRIVEMRRAVCGLCLLLILISIVSVPLLIAIAFLRFWPWPPRACRRLRRCPAPASPSDLGLLGPRPVAQMGPPYATICSQGVPKTNMAGDLRFTLVVTALGIEIQTRIETAQADLDFEFELPPNGQQDYEAIGRLLRRIRGYDACWRRWRDLALFYMAVSAVQRPNGTIWEQVAANLVPRLHAELRAAIDGVA